MKMSSENEDGEVGVESRELPCGRVLPLKRRPEERVWADYLARNLEEKWTWSRAVQLKMQHLLSKRTARKSVKYVCMTMVVSLNVLVLWYKVSLCVG